MRNKYKNNFSKGYQVSLFKTYKNGGDYCWGQTQLERNAQRFYEYDPEVISYESQPKQYAYFDGEGEERSYTPDLALKTIYGDEDKEVKPFVFTTSARAKKKFNLLRLRFDEAKNRNLSYVTDKVIYAGLTTENLKHIHHYRRLDISKISIPSLVEAIGKTPNFGALKAYIESLGLFAKHALAILGHQIYRFNYQEKLNDNTQLTFLEE